MAVLEAEKKTQPNNTNKNKNKNKNENKNHITNTELLIPGLPNEMAELCLLHLPYPYQSLVRSVSSSWNRAITDPSFLQCKKTLSRPYLFVFAFHKLTNSFQWQALDPSSPHWFILPTMPPTGGATAAAACTSIPKQGKLFVMGGAMYSTTTNQWSLAAAVPRRAHPFFAAEGGNGTIVTVGAAGGSLGADIYHPDSDTWRHGARLEVETVAFEAVENEGRVFVTEGWRWPFSGIPRGWVYDVGGNTWREMGMGMREGWSGVAVAAAGKVFVIPEYGDGQVKAYDEGSDTWQPVGGDGFPREKMRRPFAAKGLEGKIYVASCGLNLAIGSVVLCEEEGQRQRQRQVQEQQRNSVELKWEVVEAPEAFRELQPCNCQVMFA